MSNKNKKILALILILVLATVAGFLFLRDSDNQQSSESGEETSEEQTIVEKESIQIEQNEASEEEKPKVSNPPPQQAPVVSTGYGQIESDPVKSGQQTSTTCTSDPGSTCIVSFRKSSGGQTIRFEPKTLDSSGVAVWYWKGGDQVGSGKWTVFAEVNQSKSNEEVIYVE